MSLVKGVQKFTDLLKHLKDDASARVQMLVDGQFDSDTPDIYDVQSLATDADIDQGFDRADLNNAFKDEQAGSFTVAKKIGISAQADVIAGLHKAAIFRFRPRIKALIIGGLRDAGQTTPYGYISFAMEQLPLTEQTDSEGDSGE